MYLSKTDDFFFNLYCQEIGLTADKKRGMLNNVSTEKKKKDKNKQTNKRTTITKTLILAITKGISYKLSVQCRRKQGLKHKGKIQYRHDFLWSVFCTHKIFNST